MAHAIAVNGASAGEQRVDPEGATGPVEGRCERRAWIEGDAGLGQTAPVAGQAIPSDEQGAGAGQERDPPVPELDQRGDHRRDPAGVVDAHVRLATGMRRQVDDRRAVGPHRGEMPVDLLVDRRVVEPAAREHDGRRAHGPQQPDVRAFPLGIPLRAAGDDEVAVDRGGILHAADDLREVRVRDVVDDDADDRHPALEQAARQGVGHVVERPGGLEDALARGGADRVVRGRDDPRRGRGRHAGEPGDLGDRCHRATGVRVQYGYG